MSESYHAPPYAPTSSNGNGVRPEQRFTHGRTCPICHGSENERRGSGERCFGFLSDDGRWAHCTREDHAGRATLRGGSGTFAHLLKGKCPCGTEHAPADPKPKRPNAKPKRPKLGPEVERYHYRARDGSHVFDVVRYAVLEGAPGEKTFRQCRPGPDGKDVCNLKGVELVPYRLPDLLAADPGDLVLVAEGEKDVDALRKLGFTATCNPMGAGKWRDAYSPHLAGRHVVILPDNDKAGRDHAQAVARSLHGVAKSVKVVELPELPEKGDVSDWIARGGTAQGLREIIEGAPVWTPPAEADDVPRFAGGFDTETKGRVIIRITPDFHVSVFDAAAALARHPGIYTRVGTLARVISHPGNDDDTNGVKRVAGSPVIATVGPDDARVWLSAAARFQKFDMRSDDWIFAPPPKDLAAAVLGLKNYPGGRELTAVIEAPTLRPDGSLLDTPGYDRATGVLFVPNAHYPGVVDRPTLDDARRAADELLDLVVDFPFVDECHKAAFLSAMLTPIARFAIDGPCPLFLFDSPVSGSGKTKLCDLIAVAAAGRIMARSHYAKDEDEMRKIITSVVMAGDRMVLFDNVETTFGNAALDAALTGRTWKDRILGRSEMTPDLPLNVVWFATGINIALGSTMFRRAVTCRIQPEVERPEERQNFTYPDVVAAAEARRPQLVAAALTLLRAFIVAERPDLGLTPFASFEAWSSLVRNAVVWVKDFDPCANRDDLRAADAKLADTQAVINGWAELPGGKCGLTVREALEFVNADPKKYQTLFDVFASWGRKEIPGIRVIASRLKKYRGRVVGGLLFEVDTTREPSVWKARPIR